MFTDVFPATIADSILNNAPVNVGFTLFGPAIGGPTTSPNPTDPTSGQSVTSASNAGFQSGFANAASYIPRCPTQLQDLVRQTSQTRSQTELSDLRRVESRTGTSVRTKHSFRPELCRQPRLSRTGSKRRCQCLMGCTDGLPGSSRATLHRIHPSPR